MRREVLGFSRPATTPEIRWRGRKDARRFSQLSRDGARIRQRAEPERHIDPVDNQILALIADAKIDAQRGVALQKLRQTRDDFPNAKAGRDGDPEQAAQFPRPARRMIGFLEG